MEQFDECLYFDPRSCQLIVNEELQKNVYADSQMYEHQRFQVEKFSGVGFVPTSHQFSQGPVLLSYPFC
jgi:hypothetical protein